MSNPDATMMATGIIDSEVMPFLRSLDLNNMSEEVFLAFCQSMILTVTNIMHNFCVSCDEFDNKNEWIQDVKDNIHSGIDKFFNEMRPKNSPLQ